MTTDLGSNPAAAVPDGSPTAPDHTGSPRTRVLGIVVLAAIALWLFLGLVGTPADQVQGEAVRIMYVHVPVVMAAYISCFVGTAASGMWLWKRTQFWDVLASSAIELSVPFTAGTLLTGAIWGGAAWGTFWVWDARITSTALLFLLELGYLAVRRIPASRGARARRSAVLGLLLAPNIFIINQSVNWWRSIHQSQTVFEASPSPKISGIMFFTFVFSLVVAGLLFAWLLIHRFRVGYLEDQVDDVGLERALTERRSEGR